MTKVSNFQIWDKVAGWHGIVISSCALRKTKEKKIWVISRFQELIAFYADLCASKKKGMSILHLLWAIFLTDMALSVALKAPIVAL